MLQSLISFLYRWIDENNLQENESENAVRDELARKHGLYVGDCSARHPIDWYRQNRQYTHAFIIAVYYQIVLREIMLLYMHWSK
jgi:hypothetical protein